MNEGKNQDSISGLNITIIGFNQRGGLVHYACGLAHALSKQNHVTMVGPINMEGCNAGPEMNIRRMNLGNTFKNFLISMTRPWRLIEDIVVIRGDRPDVIHFQECYPWMALMLPFLSDIPIVITIHDAAPHVGSRAYTENLSKRICLPFADRVIVHGEYAKNKLQYNDKDRVRIVPHGDFTFFNSNAIEKPQEPNTVLFFGRITKYKGLDLLIAAIKGLVEKGRSVKLVVAGSGNMTGYTDIPEAAKWIEVHNRYIEDDEVAGFFSRASMVVLPYIEVTQSGIIQIAFAFKRPVIATDVGCLSEVIENGQNGIIIPSNSVDAIASAVEKLLDDPELARKLGENGFQTATQRFNWDIVAQMTMEVYGEATSGK